MVAHPPTSCLQVLVVPETASLHPALLIVAALAFPAGARGERCNPPDEPNALGPTYVTAQTVKGVSCKDGRPKPHAATPQRATRCHIAGQGLPVRG